MEEFLTVKEVAKKLRVCERTVIRNIEQKKLRAAKIGQWRIKLADLDAFFNANANIQNHENVS